MLIEIDDRLYNDFVTWAQVNNMGEEDIRKYIEKAFRDKYTIDKYGDLNDKLVKEEKPKKTRKKAEPKKEEPVVTEPVDEPVNELIAEPIVEEKPKRKTRVIASK